MIFFGIMISFALFNGILSRGSNIDSWGHLGGFIIGLPLGIIFLEDIDPTQQIK